MANYILSLAPEAFSSTITNELPSVARDIILRSDAVGTLSKLDSKDLKQVKLYLSSLKGLVGDEEITFSGDLLTQLVRLITETKNVQITWDAIASIPDGTERESIMQNAWMNFSETQQLLFIQELFRELGQQSNFSFLQDKVVQLSDRKNFLKFMESVGFWKGKYKAGLANIMKERTLRLFTDDKAVMNEFQRFNHKIKSWK